MSFHFNCPHCQAATDVTEEYAGQTGPCWNCGREVELPHDSPAKQKNGDDVFRAEIVPAESVPTAEHAAAPSASRARDILQQQSSRKSGIWIKRLLWLVGIVFVGGILWLIIRSLDSSIGLLAETDAMRARKNLSRIGMAMQMYHNEYDSFPPAFIPDKNGKPIHSWRVLLLPYLGEQTLYDQYNFDQPWDSQENAFLFARMPRVYSSEYIEQYSATSESSYMVIVGDETAFPGEATRTLDDLADGAANTILVVEIEALGTSWLEPVDLDATIIDYSINGNSAQGSGIQGTGIGSSQVNSPRDGAMVLTADGKVHKLSNACPEEIVETFVSIAGGEQDLIETVEE